MSKTVFDVKKDLILLHHAFLTRVAHNINRNNLVLEKKIMLPAIGQGVLAIEVRKGDNQTLNWIQHLDDASSRDCVTAEREVLLQLEGNCQIPLAGHCINENEQLYLKALIGTPDGKRLIRAEGCASRKKSKDLGRSVSKQILDQGGRELLNQLYKWEKS